MKYVIGIDPGLSGAVAQLSSDGAVEIWDMPTVKVKRNKKNKTDLDMKALGDILYPLKGVAYVEQVGAMPGQGVTSMFAFGKAYGAVLGVLGAFEMEVRYVVPSKWKARLRVPPGKDGSGWLAEKLYPEHKKLWFGPRGGLKDGRAEALLIAHYGLMEIMK